MAQKLLSHDHYTVGWICALPLEMAAAKAMLDEIHPRLPQPLHDHNSYVLGKIAGHNLAVACLPSGIYGTTSASVVAEQMLSTFPSMRFGLMVGIGGGAPSPQADIRLGDIVVSRPTGLLPGVVQYDYGKTIASGCFERTGTLNLPPRILLTALSDVQSDHMTGKTEFHEFLLEGLQSVGGSVFFYPGQERDQLFKAAYFQGVSADCVNCDPSELISRIPRPHDTPEVHYGIIASGNQVMKNGQIRDNLAHSLGILCFEMEAAGLMDHFPCLVIRGICDYSDSHKNKIWQGYAALTAAAYAKELLLATPVAQIKQSNPVGALKDADSMFNVRFNTINIPRSANFTGRDQELMEIRERLENSNDLQAAITLQGAGGLGKTQIAVAYAMRHCSQYSAVFWLNARDVNALQSSFLEAAKRILRDHPDLKHWREIIVNYELSEAVTAVKEWLSVDKNDRWLLIYDGYDTPTFSGYDEQMAFKLETFLPEARQGHIIVTTTTSRAGFGYCLQVARLESNVGIEILSKVSRRQGLHQDLYARAIVGHMDGLPLAITSAGAYLERSALSTRDYLELYKSSWASLQSRSPRLSSYADKTLFSTWEVSLRQIRQINRLSESILKLWVAFDHQDIWFELLYSRDRTMIDKLLFHEAMSVICDYGLAEIGSLRGDTEEPRGYRMHKCVHTWLNQHYGVDLNSCFAVLDFIERQNPIHSMSFDLVQRILPHANRCCEHIFDTEATKNERYDRFLHLAMLYERAGSGNFVRLLSNPTMEYAYRGIHHYINAERIYKKVYENTKIDDTTEEGNREFSLLVQEFTIMGLINLYRKMIRTDEVRRWQLLALEFYHQKRWKFKGYPLNYYKIRLDLIMAKIWSGSLLPELLTIIKFLNHIWTDPISLLVLNDILVLCLTFGIKAFKYRWAQRWKVAIFIFLTLVAIQLRVFFEEDKSGKFAIIPVFKLLITYVGVLMTLKACELVTDYSIRCR